MLSFPTNYPVTDVHMNIIHCFVPECVVMRETTEFEYAASATNVSDILTQALVRPSFEIHAALLCRFYLSFIWVTSTTQSRLVIS